MLENQDQKKKCKKCSENIGGRAYYVVKLDCINDGQNLTSCESVVLCSNCYHNLYQWLHE